MKVICVIPARLESTRMERKLLRSSPGISSVIVQTIRAAARYPFDRVIVATDSTEIKYEIAGVERSCCYITGECKSGSDRIAEIVNRYESLESSDLIVNIQADEPEIKPEHIKALIDAATMVPGCDMATLAAPLKPDEWNKQNVVKVLVNKQTGFAEQFSRHSWKKDAADDVNEFHHLGVYAYTPRFLKWFTSLPQSPNEEWERLEQLRALDNGARIRVAIVDEAWPGIDTEEEYQAFVKRWKERQCPTTQSASA